MTSFLLRGFKRPGEAVDEALGHLERQVLEALWNAPQEKSVRQVAEGFGALAYTTVLTTLDRLFKKGLVERRKEGRAFVYRPRLSRDEIQHGMLRELFDRALRGAAGAPRPVLSSLVDSVSEADARLLDDLESLVREKKRRAKAQGKA